MRLSSWYPRLRLELRIRCVADSANVEGVVPTVLVLCTRSTLQKTPSATPAHRVLVVVWIRFGLRDQDTQPTQSSRLHHRLTYLGTY